MNLPQTVDIFRRTITQKLIEEDSARAVIELAVQLFEAEMSGATKRTREAQDEQMRAMHSQRIASDLYNYASDTVGHHVSIAARLHAHVSDMTYRVAQLNALVDATNEGQHIPREDVVRVLAEMPAPVQFETKLIAWTPDRRHSIGKFEDQDGAATVRPFLGWAAVVCGPSGGRGMEGVFLQGTSAYPESAMDELFHLKLREIQ